MVFSFSLVHAADNGAKYDDEEYDEEYDDDDYDEKTAASTAMPGLRGHQTVASWSVPFKVTQIALFRVGATVHLWLDSSKSEGWN